VLATSPVSGLRRSKVRLAVAGSRAAGGRDVMTRLLRRQP
jgi:hypothetical protein